MSRVATGDDGAPPVEHVGARVHAPCGCWRGGAGRRFGFRETGRARRKVRWYRGLAPRRLPIGGGDPASCATALDDRPGRRRNGRSCAAPDANVSAGAPVRARYCPKCLRHSAGPSGESSHQYLLPAEQPPIIRRAGAVPAPPTGDRATVRQAMHAGGGPVAVRGAWSSAFPDADAVEPDADVGAVGGVV